jgi:hypothetical protein
MKSFKKFVIVKFHITIAPRIILFFIFWENILQPYDKVKIKNYMVNFLFQPIDRYQQNFFTLPNKIFGYIC